jgi:hypothetical protein
MSDFVGVFDTTGCGVKQHSGGAGGIRTLDRALQPYNGLANRRLQPLGHSSVGADMPDTGASRKRQIARRQIPGGLAVKITGLSGRPGYSGLQSQILTPNPGAAAI